VAGPSAIDLVPATVVATRYVTPLREGGSLPALVEASDDGYYVLKFRGAGQGAKALVAELVAGEVARLVGLSVPDLVFVEVDPALGAAEPDPEIQELLNASPGLNLGMDFLPGALPYDPATGEGADPALAAEVVWLDALLTNVDRTARNPNLLVWHGRLWLIDHGAALYLHHRGWRIAPLARRPFPPIAEHVLLPVAGPIQEADARLAPRIDRAALERILAAVPDGWLVAEGEEGDPGAHRREYVDYLMARLAPPRPFVEEAERARAGA
jgi:hypothetical protein